MKVIRQVIRVIAIALAVVFMGVSGFKEKVSIASCCSDHQCKSVAAHYYVVTYLLPKDGDCSKTCDTRFYTDESAMLPHVYRLVGSGNGYCRAQNVQQYVSGAYQSGWWGWLDSCVRGARIEGSLCKCTGTDCTKTC